MTTLTTGARTTTGARPVPRPDMLTYARLDLRRQLRDRFGMFFVVGLPTFMYLVFGLGSEDPVGSGNVAMYVMISMAAYGAVTATTSVAGSAATEQVMGWGRQLGLTPMRIPNKRASWIEPPPMPAIMARRVGWPPGCPQGAVRNAASAAA